MSNNFPSSADCKHTHTQSRNRHKYTATHTYTATQDPSLGCATLVQHMCLGQKTQTTITTSEAEQPHTHSPTHSPTHTTPHTHTHTHNKDTHRDRAVVQKHKQMGRLRPRQRRALQRLAAVHTCAQHARPKTSGQPCLDARRQMDGKHAGVDDTCARGYYRVLRVTPEQGPPLHSPY
jgi:hypothetical protein